MARIKYQPSTRVKQFSPIQLSKEGITQMQRDSDRIIRGLQNNFQAEKEQQDRDRAAMVENADLEQDRIKRNREIEIDNLKNEQTALSQQINIDRQQSDFDADAKSRILDSISNFSKTAKAKSDTNHANMIKDQTEAAKKVDIQKYVDYGIKRLYSARDQATIREDANIIENAFETDEPLEKTLRALINSSGRGGIQDEIILNRTIAQITDIQAGKAFKETEAIYTDAAGNKFSGVEAYSNKEKALIVWSDVHAKVKERLGADLAAPGYLDRSDAIINKKKEAFADSAQKRDLEKITGIAEDQAKIFESGGKATDYVQAYNLRRNVFGRSVAHERTFRNPIVNPSIPIEEISRAVSIIEGVSQKDYEKNPEKYSIENENNRWYKQFEPKLTERNNNRRKAVEANQKIRQAQVDEYFVQVSDNLIAAVKENPLLAEQRVLKTINDTNTRMPPQVKNTIKYALAELETEDRARMNSTYTNSKLTREFINNNIRHPTVKKEAAALFEKQQIDDFGPDYPKIEEGLIAFAKKAAEEGGSQDVSGRALLIRSHTRKWLQNDIKNVTNDALTSRTRYLELYNKAKLNRDSKEADPLNPFYQTTDDYNNVIFRNIESPKVDQIDFRITGEFALKKYGADVKQYPYSVETPTETDITIASYRETGKPIFSLNLISKVDYLNKSNPDKKPLSYSEYFNEMQKGKTSLEGKYHPTIENNFNTQFLDSLNPENAKLQAKAHHFVSHELAKRTTINSTVGVDNGMTLKSMTRGSMVQRTGMRGLADLVSSGEGSPTSMFPGENYPEMTNMTIKEVVELQKEKLRDGRKSAAVGSYQFLYPEIAAQRAGLSLDEKFTFENQLKMFGGTLLNKPGRENLSAFLQGIGGDIETALDQLSQEFSSIEYRDGRSYYNDGVNKASISRDQARAALLSAREEFTTQ